MRGLGAQGEASKAGRAGHVVQPWDFIPEARGWGHREFQAGSFVQPIPGLPVPRDPELGARRAGTTPKEIQSTKSTHEYVLSCSEVLGPSMDVVRENWQDPWPPRMNKLINKQRRLRAPCPRPEWGLSEHFHRTCSSLKQWSEAI